MSINNYEMVIGLEVHVELKVESKIFCSCSTKYGAEPNTQCCPICMGMPGVLPTLNKKVVEYGIKAGIATNCRIETVIKMDRKNYFYPDLPKAYQISQYDIPLCSGGYLEIECKDTKKRIGITRIHIEEDAGKLIHQENGNTLIDLNRGGVPLIEIVSDPDIRSVEEAKAYLQKLRGVLMYAGVSECKMNQGAFRCDVNLSVRKKGEETLGIRTEMKNLNSFQFIGNAIEYEYKRQVEELEKGNQIKQETRKYDQVNKKTVSIRDKEVAADYRFFPEPDLMPIVIPQNVIDKIISEMPMLLDERRGLYLSQYGLSNYDVDQLISNKEIAVFFEETLKHTSHAKIVANIILTDLFRLITLDQIEINISPKHMASLAELIHSETINSNTAKDLFNKMWIEDENPETIVDELELRQINDEQILEEIINEVMNMNQKVVEDYLGGKTNVVRSLIGQGMKRTKGKGNPRILQQILERKLMERRNDKRQSQ